MEILEFIDFYKDLILSSLTSLIKWGGIFWIISMLLPQKKKPVGVSENFAVINKGNFLFNGEFKVEISLFFFNAIILAVYLSAILVFLGNSMENLFPEYKSMKISFIEDMHFAVQFFIIILIIDFISFFSHYFMHKFLWPYHSIHHAAKKVSWLTTNRLHPIGKIIFTSFFLIFSYFLGFPAEVLAIALIFDGFYNLFVHANISLEYPKPIRYLFGSPNFHKWHHCLDDKKAYDKNFGTIFSIFDVVFGTYYHPEGRLPKEYGIKAPKAVGNTEGFFASLIYPFKWHILNLKKMVTKRKK